MEKFAKLREKVKREIALDQEVNQSNKVLQNYLNKLLAIDYSYFNEKYQQFDQEFSWENVYLDKNPDEQPYHPDFKYDLQNLLAELEKDIEYSKEPLHARRENKNQEIHNILLNETLINKPTYEKYRSILEDILNQKTVYYENIKNVEQETTKSNRKIETELNMTVIKNIRANDNRTTQEMIREVNSVIDENHNSLLSVIRKYKVKYLPIIILFSLIIVCLVALIILFVLL